MQISINSSINLPYRWYIRIRGGFRWSVWSDSPEPTTPGLYLVNLAGMPTIYRVYPEKTLDNRCVIYWQIIDQLISDYRMIRLRELMR